MDSWMFEMMLLPCCSCNSRPARILFQVGENQKVLAFALEPLILGTSEHSEEKYLHVSRGSNAVR
jgi:hypothetical protein